MSASSQNLQHKLIVLPLILAFGLIGCINADISWDNSDASITSTSSNASGGTTSVLTIESAPDGSGHIIKSGVMSAGSPPNTAFAVLRDSKGGFISSPTVNWSITGGVGTASPTVGSSTSVTGSSVGTGSLVANLLSPGPLSATLDLSVIALASSVGARTYLTQGWASGLTSWSMDVTEGMNFPGGVAIDASGMVYVADTGSSRISRYDLATGSYLGSLGYKIAGTTGTCPVSAGFTGVWCTGATFAASGVNGALSSPYGLGLDLAGNLLVVDQGNQRVSKYVAATGAYVGSVGYKSTSSGTCVNSPGATTGWCTGGSFTSASVDGAFSAPKRITLDNTSDGFFVTDTNNHRVSKYVTSTGAYVGSIGYKSSSSGTCVNSPSVTTSWCTGGAFATNTINGSFNIPAGIAADPAGNALYISDSANHSIAKYILNSGLFVGSIGYKGPGSAGTCGVSGTVTPGWCTLGVFASSAFDGGLASPDDVMVDAISGMILVADVGNNRISKFNISTGNVIGSLGNITANAGSCPATPGFTGTWCMGGSYQFGVGDGMFNAPSSLALTPSGAQFVAVDRNNSRLMQFSKSTGSFAGALGSYKAAAPSWSFGKPTQSGANDGMMALPSGVAMDGAGGFFYVADRTNNRVSKFDTATGTSLGSIGNKGAGTTGTCPAASGAVAGWCTGGIFVAGAGNGMFNNPLRLALDSQGFLYVSDSINVRVSKFSAATGAYIGSIGYKSVGTSGTCIASAGFTSGWCTGGTFAVNASVDDTFNVPRGLAIDSSGYLYVSDGSGNRIMKFNLTSGAYVGSIGFKNAGTVASIGTSPTCTASGIFTGGWCSGSPGYGPGAGDGALSSPIGIAVDTAGNLYVADTGNHRISKYLASTGAYIGSMGYSTSSSGTCSAAVAFTGGWCTGGSFITGTGDGMVSSPQGISVDNTGMLLVSDTSNHRISLYQSAGGNYWGSIGNKGVGTTGSCPTAAGFTPTWCNGGTFVSGTGDGMLSGPVDAQIDSNGLVYVVDTNNFRVQRLAP